MAAVSRRPATTLAMSLLVILGLTPRLMLFIPILNLPLSRLYSSQRSSIALVPKERNIIRDTDSRLAIAATLLSFQSAVFAFDIVALVIRTVSSFIQISIRADSPRYKFNISFGQGPRFWWSVVLEHLAAPISISLLGAVLIPIMFVETNSERPRIASAAQCKAELGADIGGDGIRISIWTQEYVLILMAILGTFHCGATGAKEIGAGLAITHAAWAIAMLVQMARKTLSSADAIIGSMILDSQSSALSIQPVAKETLATWWQVCVIVLCQVFGLSVLPVFIQNFSSGTFAIKQCRCLSVFWWAWLSDCSEFPSWEISILDLLHLSGPWLCLVLLTLSQKHHSFSPC